MRLAAAQRTALSDEDLCAMDWTAIGGLVRRWTLEEVSAHFHSLSVQHGEDTPLSVEREQDEASS